MDLSRYAVLASLSLPVPTVRRQDKEATRETLARRGAEQDAGVFVKRLYPPERLEPLVQAQARARRVHDEHSFPWPVGQGVRLVPLSRLGAYQEAMEAALDKVREEVSRFTDAGHWQAMLQEARTMLGGMFDGSLYPQPEELREKLEPRLRLAPVPSGDMVDEFLSEVVGHEAREVIRRSVDDTAVEAVVQAARQAVEEVRSRLRAVREAATGERQRFHTSHLEALRRTLLLAKGLPLPQESQRRALETALEEVSALLDDLTAERVRLARRNPEVAESLRVRVAEADARLADIDRELGL